MKKKVLFLLFLLIFGLGIVSAKEEYTLNKIWSSKDTTQLNPNFSFSNEAYKFGDNLLYVENTQTNDGSIGAHFAIYNESDFKIKSEFEIEPQKGYEPVYRVYGDYLFYTTSFCTLNDVSDFSSGYGCNYYLNILDKNLKNEKKLKIDWVMTYIFNSLEYLENTLFETIYVDDEGSYIFYSTYKDYLKLDKDFNKVIIIPKELDEEDDSDTKTVSDYEKYFDVLVQFNNKNNNSDSDSSKNELLVKYTSYLDYDDENTVITGYVSDETKEKKGAYMQFLSDGKIIKEYNSDRYVSYSNPIKVKDFIVIKATYDTEKTLGTEKSDILLFNKDGEQVGSYNNSSYFNNMISYGDYFVTERVYVEGNCGVTQFGTYNLWNVNSCATHHFYEKYTPIVMGATDIENSDTSAFPIIIFIVSSMIALVIVRFNVDKMKNLNIF